MVVVVVVVVLGFGEKDCPCGCWMSNVQYGGCGTIDGTVASKGSTESLHAWENGRNVGGGQFVL